MNNSVCWQRPVDGRLSDYLVIQRCSLNEFVADAILKTTVDLRTTSMSMEELEHLHLLVSVQVEFRHLAIQSHQNTTGFLERTHIATKQLVGESFCEGLERNRKGQ